MQKYAFRCVNCGHLHEASHAGDVGHPHHDNCTMTCAVCGFGASFHPKRGTKSGDKENWEILADCTDARLKELGLEKSQIQAPVIKEVKSPVDPKNISVGVVEGTGLKDSQK